MRRNKKGIKKFGTCPPYPCRNGIQEHHPPIWTPLLGISFHFISLRFYGDL